MTRKDYVLIAGSLNKSISVLQRMGRSEAVIEDVKAVVRQLAATLSAENDRFDVERFILAVIRD